jgi:hypothetical protein
MGPRMRKNFYWSGMKGEPAREDQLKFSMRGGLFEYFLPKQKVLRRITFSIII